MAVLDLLARMLQFLLRVLLVPVAERTLPTDAERRVCITIADLVPLGFSRPIDPEKESWSTTASRFDRGRTTEYAYEDLEGPAQWEGADLMVVERSLAGVLVVVAVVLLVVSGSSGGKFGAGAVQFWAVGRGYAGALAGIGAFFVGMPTTFLLLELKDVFDSFFGRAPY